MAHMRIGQMADLNGYRPVIMNGERIGSVVRVARRYGGGCVYKFKPAVKLPAYENDEFTFDTMSDLKDRVPAIVAQVS